MPILQCSGLNFLVNLKSFVTYHKMWIVETAATLKITALPAYLLDVVVKNLSVSYWQMAYWEWAHRGWVPAVGEERGGLGEVKRGQGQEFSSYWFRRTEFVWIEGQFHPMKNRAVRRIYISVVQGMMEDMFHHKRLGQKLVPRNGQR